MFDRVLNTQYFLSFVYFLQFFHPKKHRKIHLRPFKQLRLQTNLISLFEIHVKVFEKIVIEDFFCHICQYCSGNIQLLRCYLPKKTPKSYNRSLKWLWHSLNLLAFFRVYNKISDKIVSQVVLWKFSNIFKVLFTF